MPYKCEGSTLYHFKDGKWSIKQQCDNPDNCQGAMRLLYGLESGSIKKVNVGKPTAKRSAKKYKILK